MIVDLKTSFDVYEELLAKTQKGIDFYKKVEENVKRLLERTGRVCKVQNEERQQILERLKPKGWYYAQGSSLNLGTSVKAQAYRWD